MDEKLMYILTQVQFQDIDLISAARQIKSLMAENPEDVSDSLDSSGALNTGYQMEGEAVGSKDTSESVTVPLPKRIEDENEECHQCPHCDHKSYLINDHYVHMEMFHSS